MDKLKFLSHFVCKLSVWHHIKQENFNDSTIVIKCTSTRNDINLTVQGDQTFIFDACARLKLRVHGNATSSSITTVVLLVADDVDLQEVKTVNNLRIYSDANFTSINSLSVKSFWLDTPSTTVNIDNARYQNLDLSINGPRSVTISNTVMKESRFSIA